MLNSKLKYIIISPETISVFDEINLKSELKIIEKSQNNYYYNLTLFGEIYYHSTTYNSTVDYAMKKNIVASKFFNTDIVGSIILMRKNNNQFIGFDDSEILVEYIKEVVV